MTRWWQGPGRALQAAGKGVTRAPVDNIFTLTLLVPVLAVLAGACGSPAYKIVDVPHCKVAGEAAGKGFNHTLMWIYTTGSMNGSGPLTGAWPKLGLGVADSVDSAKPVLAVVSCPAVQGSGITTVSSEPGSNLGPKLTAEAVPALCPGQQVLFHGTLTAADDAAAKAKGYDGVSHFPTLDLTCSEGTLAKTTSTDIEQRPK